MTMIVDCFRIQMRVRCMEKSVPIYAHDNIFPERMPTAALRAVGASFVS